MGDAGGFLRFPASLDPQAQEFRPRDHYHRHVIPPHHLPAVLPPPQPFYYPAPPPMPQPFGYHQYPFQNHIVSINNYDRSPPLECIRAELPPPPVAPTRAILLCSLPADFRVSETLVRRELEVFGEVRGVQMERIRDGIVIVHFYDIRHAEAALEAIQLNHRHRMQRRPFAGWTTVWAQFTIPSVHVMPEGQNQGTIVVFNLDPTASASLLRRIFQSYGAVKEIRETPMKKQQRFVEFYDVRDAARALNEMNGKEILGKAVVIEFSRPGGFNRKFFNSYAPKIPSPKYIPLPPPPPAARFNNRFSCEGTSISPPLGRKGLNFVGNGKDGKRLIQSQSHNQSQISQKKSSGKGWKGSCSKYESRFLINDESSIVESSSSSNCSSDSRTTVMIKNIPNKYSQKLLLNMLDNHCIHCNEQISGANDDNDQNQPHSSYDFVYLPIDFNNKCNVGYGFVNMTSPEAARRLYKAFHHQHWEVFNSKKICEVTYARVQGLEALKEHFKNSKFPSETEQYLPVVFSPARDGRRLTEPMPIVCLKQQIENGEEQVGSEGGGGGDGDGDGDGDGVGDSDGSNSNSCSSSSNTTTSRR